MRKIWLKIVFWLTEDRIREICLVLGFFSFGAGIWLIYPPAALIICGALLMRLGLPPLPRRDKK